MEPDLFHIAKEARLFAYAPYSQFKVGAALLTDDGRIFTGCNVENISFGLTCCAERVAIFAAIASGCLAFREILIVADSKQPVSPCGACRQVMAEYAPELKVTCMNLDGASFTASLEALLPRAKVGILGT
jgi:cytidine deaminase